MDRYCLGRMAEYHKAKSTGGSTILNGYPNFDTYLTTLSRNSLRSVCLACRLQTPEYCRAISAHSMYDLARSSSASLKAPLGTIHK